MCAFGRSEIKSLLMFELVCCPSSIITHITDLVPPLTRWLGRVALKILRGGYVYKSKLKGRHSLCVAALFPQSDASTKVNLMIDEITIKRIHIEEKIRGHLLSICQRSQWFITPSCFDHIRKYKCPNDSRRIMPFVTSIPFWFLAGKYALENSSIVCRVPL